MTGQKTTAGKPPANAPYKNPTLPVSERADDLLGRMTTYEKIGQMTQLDITLINTTGKQRDIRLDAGRARHLIRNHHIGSFLNGEAVDAADWYAFMEPLTRIAMEESRLGIPILYGIDHIHGATYLQHSTIFPQGINLGATFNPEHARNTGAVTALECADLGHHWVFAPVLDLGVNPLWARFYETYGEDPYLAGLLGAAFVDGMQNHPETSPYRVAATAKHFLGYSNPASGWDRTPASLSMQEIHEFHRPSFQKAIDAGLKTIMVNSGEINGIPVHASREILTNLLREQMGFEGVIVTDWDDIGKLVDFHYTAANFKEATFDAIQAGIDMSMTPLHLKFNTALLELVEEGRVSMARIDASVRRILTMKFELGLFEHPFPRKDRLHRIGSAANRAKASEAARDSIVLLKNEKETLPVIKPRKIGVFGMAVRSRRNLCGGWTLAWQGGDEDRFPGDMATIFTALQQEFPDAEIVHLDVPVDTQPKKDPQTSHLHLHDGTAINSTTLKPTPVTGKSRKQFEQNLKGCDLLIYAGGEEPYCEFVGNINDLHLPAAETAAIREVRCHSNAPMVMVLIEGRPRLIHHIIDLADAVLFAGLPGPEGPEAIAGILSGRHNPAGRLPFSYPMSPNHHLTYNHKRSNLYFFDPDVANHIIQGNTTASLFPFGFGLSYTTFAYSKLRLSTTKALPGDEITGTVTVSNTGNRDGIETVLWFTSTHHGKVSRPVKELRHFEKISLPAGESATVTFRFTPEMLAYPNGHGEPVLENGSYSVRVGGLERKFRVEQPSRSKNV